jgi:hypothetical protein
VLECLPSVHKALCLTPSNTHTHTHTITYSFPKPIIYKDVGESVWFPTMAVAASEPQLFIGHFGVCVRVSHTLCHTPETESRADFRSAVRFPRHTGLINM